MHVYSEDILEETPKDMDNEARTPAKDNLFTVNHSSPLLNKEMTNFLHRLTIRLSFAGKRARPEMQVAAAFFCTRVKVLNESDYVKLARFIQYIRHTIHIPLVLRWDGSGTPLWS